MNCYHHPDQVAVATCGQCGKSMCKECVDKSEYTLDGKPLCRDCNLAIAQSKLAEALGERRKNLIKIIVLGIFVAIGLPLFIYGCAISNSDVIIASLLVLCIGGIPTAWKATKRSARDKARDAADDWVADQEGVGGSLMNSLIRGLVRIVLVVVIGSVAAPILLIIAVVKYVKSGKEIPVLQEQVDNFEI